MGGNTMEHSAVLHVSRISATYLCMSGEKPHVLELVNRASCGSNSSFVTKSVIVKFCRSASSGFPAGAVFCPPSCSGKQHMFLGKTLPGERVGQEN